MSIQIYTILESIFWICRKMPMHLFIHGTSLCLQMPDRCYRNTPNPNKPRYIYDHEIFLYILTFCFEMLASLFVFFNPAYAAYIQGGIGLIVLIHTIHFPHDQKLVVNIATLLYYLPSMYILASWLIVDKMLYTSYYELNSAIIAILPPVIILLLINSIISSIQDILTKLPNILQNLIRHIDLVTLTVALIIVYHLYNLPNIISMIQQGIMFFIRGSPIMPTLALTLLYLLLKNDSNPLSNGFILRDPLKIKIPLPSIKMIQSVATSYQAIRMIVPKLTFLPFQLSLFTFPSLLSIEFIIQAIISLTLTHFILPEFNPEQRFALKHRILFNSLMMILPCIPASSLSYANSLIHTTANASSSIPLRSFFLLSHIFLVLNKHQIKDNQTHLVRVAEANQPEQ